MATANGKRKHDAIDLTGDDDSQPGRPAPGNGVSQSQRDSWLAQSQEEDADDIIISTQDGDDSATANYQLYGVLETKIVGVQYYRGHATVGEYVLIRREPGVSLFDLIITLSVASRESRNMF